MSMLFVDGAEQNRRHADAVAFSLPTMHLHLSLPDCYQVWKTLEEEDG